MLPADDPFHAFMPYPPAAVPHATDGPLAGLTLAVKDIFDVAGYPTGCGQPTKLALSGVKRISAPIVSRFLEAGARCVGKTHTVELAFSLTGTNAHFGTPINPAAPDRLPGGSSSGSAAAVAGRLADIGLGSDTGGSIRAPASYCGLFGLRPTHGRLSLEGTMALAPSFDTPGWFARDARVFERVSAALLGDDPASLPAHPRWLVAEDALALCEAHARRAVEAVIARIDRMLAPLTTTRAAPGGFDQFYLAARHLQGAEAWATHRQFIETYRPALGPAIKERFEASAKIGTVEVKEAEKVRAAFRRSIAELLGQDGVLILPTTPGPAPFVTATAEELEASRAQALRLLYLAGFGGLPQISIPAIHCDGAPMGLSLIGPAGSDLSLVRAAASVANAAITRIA